MPSHVALLTEYLKDYKGIMEYSWRYSVILSTQVILLELGAKEVVLVHPYRVLLKSWMSNLFMWSLLFMFVN